MKACSSVCQDKNGEMRKVFRVGIICLLHLMGFGVLHAREPVVDPGGQRPLQAGVYKVDITPPAGISLGGYARRTNPATGIRDPLHAGVIVFDDGEARAVLVTLDLIQVKYREGQQIYHAIEKEAGIKEANVMINASHTHGSPWLETDSIYGRMVAAKVAGAVRVATENLQPVSMGFGEGEVGFNVSRRKITDAGKYFNTLNPEGVTDHRVKILRIDSQGSADSPYAALFHVVCHPNAFNGRNTRITADFPGEAKTFIERNFGRGTTALFLQGCCGDIRPNLPEEGKGADDPSFGRNGSETDMRWCGWSTGAEVVKTITWLGVREQVKQRQENNRITAVSGLIRVSAKERAGEVVWPREHIIDGQVLLRVKIISIGDICFVALPGEPVVEYGLKIEESLQELAYAHVFMMGFSDGDAGYIPTKDMFNQGGYEVTESALLPSCEEEIVEGIVNLAKGLIEQVK